LKWEPQEPGKNPGDLEIQWKETEPIFVEVKGRDWQGELSKDELRAKRQDQPKYINADARFVAPDRRHSGQCERIGALENALPKLAPNRCNLVVVVDDLFLSPTENPREFVEPRIRKALKEDPKYALVGAVFLLNAVSYLAREGVEYRFIPNESATKPLPQAVVDGLMLSSGKK
jgi:hypothetical protein